MDLMGQNALIAFGLTLFAGLATSIGSCIAFFAKRTNTKFLSISMGFSAGVMLYVSFVEIFPKAKISLTESLGVSQGTWITVLSFFGGILIIALIDKMIPSYENPHEMHKVEDNQDTTKQQDFRALHRMGMFTALAIGIHNFPEGLATFAVALKDPAVGVSIAIAIAIHNIPEGIAVSVPIFYATGSKKKAFFYSSLSGLSEPIGALLGYSVMIWVFNDVICGVLFASVAGIMVFISLDELLPGAERYGQHHLCIYGLLAGMAVMAASLLLFI